MREFLKSAILVLCCFLLVSSASAQEDRETLIVKQLDSLSAIIPGLNQKMEVSVNNSGLDEFIRAIAENHDLNVYIDHSIIGTVTNNFKDLKVKNVLAFLAYKYSLEINTMGVIMVFTKHVPPEPVKPIVIDTLGFYYFADSDKMSVNLKNDSIETFAQIFSEKTPYNLVLAPSARKVKLNVFLKEINVPEGLRKIAYAHDLQLNEEGDGMFTLEGADSGFDIASSPQRSVNKSTKGILRVNRVGSNKVNMYGKGVSISEILRECGDQLRENYFLFDDIKEMVDVFIENATFEDILNYVLPGTEYTFTYVDNSYLIGDAKKEGLRQTRLIELENRSVSQVLEAIPNLLKEGLVINVFDELNALIVSGSKFKIESLNTFVKKIDRVVPMVYLEVIILEVNETKSLEAGISAGISDKPTVSGGTILPGVDYTFDANSVNQIITGLNSLGIVNLGKVTPNFYLSIKALESNGIVNIRSTPKLTALNGQKANLNIGKTEYYVEVTNDFIGTQNPSLSSSIIYKPIEANTSVDIVPFISKDEQITLTIKVVQSDFTERITEGAPPGQVQREFNSTIRIRNGDMIILGGLDNDVSTVSTQGLPWVSRVPVLKWFFGKNLRATTKQRLSLLIKPIIIY